MLTVEERCDLVVCHATHCGTICSITLCAFWGSPRAPSPTPVALPPPACPDTSRGGHVWCWHAQNVLTLCVCMCACVRAWAWASVPQYAEWMWLMHVQVCCYYMHVLLFLQWLWWRLQISTDQSPSSSSSSSSMIWWLKRRCTAKLHRPARCLGSWCKILFHLLINSRWCSYDSGLCLQTLDRSMCDFFLHLLLCCLLYVLTC